MPDYRKLRVFALAQELSEAVHLLVPLLPARRAPGLAAQLCRAVESVPANIAEGAGRETQNDFARLLVVARASADETAVHLRLAGSVDRANTARAQDLETRAQIVAAMLTRLIARIRENEARADNERRARRSDRAALQNDEPIRAVRTHETGDRIASDTGDEKPAA